MAITDHQRQLLAELKDLPSFRLLVGLFEEKEKDLLAAIATAKSSADLVIYSRMYQCFRFVREFLAAQPEMAEAQLQSLRESQEALDGMPRDIDAFLASRFDPDREPIQ